MTQEENIKQELIDKFPNLSETIKITRARRIFVEAPAENFREILAYAYRHLKFSNLCTITGLDGPQNLSFVYHLNQDTGTVLNIKISVPKDNPVLKTVIDYFPSAEIYEREVVDLLGAKVEGLPEGNRYPLTDDWPKDEFPLRKDWKPKA